MLKKFLITITFLLFLFFPNQVRAGDDFKIEAEVVYEANLDNEFEVSYKIYLENLKTEKYTDKFILNTNGIEPFEISAFDESSSLKTDINNNQIIVYFSENLVGVNKSRNFEIKFKDTSLINKTGGVTEIIIPKLSENSIFNEYNLKVSIPKQFGSLAYISPEPKSSFESENNNYYFTKEQLYSAGVSMAFGEFQVFSFDISYHLENPLLKSAKTQIAIPPNTPYQEVFYTLLEPSPVSLEETEDGNWIATFNLSPRERLDVSAKGYVKIFSGPRFRLPVTQSFLDKNLAETEFWQVRDARIIKLAEELETPENIYNYVVDSLEYNYESATPNAKRKGAILALSSPTTSICTEFTDVFITIARAAGIPAREVNGFAYTDNPNLQPLSLVADVLHSWPEYWDKSRQSWIPVDPTWGHTTGGVDYFSKLDLKHFSFVMHGLSATEPAPPGSYKLGSNPQKDIYVSFANLPVFEENKLLVKIEQIDGFIFRNAKVNFEFYNQGPTLLMNQSVQVLFNGNLVYEDVIEKILPFNTHNLELGIPYGILGNNMPENIEIIVGEEAYEFKTDKSNKVIKDLVAILITFSILIAVTFYYFRK